MRRLPQRSGGENVAKAEERSDEAAMLRCAMGRAPLPATSNFLTPPPSLPPEPGRRRRLS